MVAFIPTCNCERDTASQTFVSDGISTIGVGNVSGTGVSVACGMGVSVKVDRLVADGLGIGVFVGTLVTVGGREVDDAVTAIAVEGSGVNIAVGVVCGCACVGRAKNNNNTKNNSRVIATINLKRSYNGAREEAVMLFVFPAR